MKISACMIAKNEENMLKRALPVFLAGLDELIVVDTGSSDNTVAVAKEAGAKVFHFPWIDDFSAARNESIKHASGDWILWIDADEVIKKEDLNRLKAFLETANGNAFLLPMHRTSIGTFSADSFYFRLKVFRNNRGYHFERAFNEQVYDKDGKIVNGDLLKDVPIYHWGKDLSQERLQEKIERNIRILKTQISSNPEDPYYHLFLANNYKDSGEYQEAVAEYEKALKNLDDPELKIEAQLQKAWCHYHLKDLKAALKTAKEIIQADPDQAGPFNIIGLCFMSAKKYQDAKSFFEHAKTLKPVQKSLINLRDYNYIPDYYLGIIYKELGEREKALVALKSAFEFEPSRELEQKIKELSYGN